MTFLDTFLSYSGNNNSHWVNKDFDALIEAAKGEADPATRMKALHDAEAIMMRDMPLAPIYFYTQMYMEKPGVRGVLRTPLGYLYFKRAWKE